MHALGVRNRADDRAAMVVHAPSLAHTFRMIKDVIIRKMGGGGGARHGIHSKKDAVSVKRFVQSARLGHYYPRPLCVCSEKFMVWWALMPEVANPENPASNRARRSEKCRALPEYGCRKRPAKTSFGWQGYR